MPGKHRLPILALTIVLAVGWANRLDGHEVAREFHDAFKVFLSSLDEAQRSAIQFDFDDQLRKDWQFVPMERKGLSFAKMKSNQRLLALSVLQTALSRRGFSQTMQVMALEQILHELENNSPRRDPDKYHWFLFGKPSLKGSWGWRIEGHHLSISFTIVDGKTVTSTPLFFGANPAKVRRGPQTGLRVLGVEEDLGRKLVQMLSDQQQKTAIIADKAPRDIINGPGRDATPLKPRGIAYQDLSAEQRTVLVNLIKRFVNKVRAPLAKQDLDRIRKSGMDKIHFAWAGSTEPGKPHYYRLQGPTFIMEYDNTQNQANHIHLVWRDFQNDFGEDLLRAHYRREAAAGKSGKRR